MALSLLSPARTVLMITDEALYVYSTGARGVKLLQTLDWEDENFENILSTLISKECGGKPVLILNDMVEQHYRKERIQKLGVSFLDKASFVQRKLHTAFPNYPIKSAFPLKEKIQKTDNVAAADIFIFAAVPASEAFSKTISAVKTSLASIAGFCLLPIESSDMVKMLSDKIAGKNKKPKWNVFIGQHRNGGLRQIVTKDGEIALTRMTPIAENDDDAAQWSGDVHQEFQATMSYLTRFGYDARDGLSVIVIADEKLHGDVGARIGTDVDVHTLTAQEAAKMIGVGLPKTAEQRLADPLHIGWAARKSKFILPMQAREIENVSKPRQMAVAASLLLLLAACFQGYQLFDQYQAIIIAKDDIQIAQRRKTQLDIEYQTEIDNKKALGYDILLVQNALKVYDGLHENEVKPLYLFWALSKTLGSELSIDRFELKRTTQNTKARQEDTSNRRSYEEPASIYPIYEAKFGMTYPGTTNIERGNREVQDLRNRLTTTLKNHDVRVTKALKDYEYTEQVVIELGKQRERSLEQDFAAEIQIRGPLK